MENICDKKGIIGICVRKFSYGTKAITADKEPLQVVALKHRRGEKAKAHLHAKRKRSIPKTQTCFIVRKGKIKIDIYNNSKKFIKSLLLNAGDLYVGLEGGHAVSYLSDAEVIEIKNGPFLEDKILIKD